MDFKLFLVFVSFLVAFKGSDAGLSSEEYWNLKLPKTPMPAFVKDMLYSEGVEGKISTSLGLETTAAEDEVFFLEKDLTTKSSIFFSSERTTQIRQKLSVNSNSKETEVMKRKAIEECQRSSRMNGETDNFCVTSLESMIDFGISKLGNKIQAFTTEIIERETHKLEKYRILGVESFFGDQKDDGKCVICHPHNYEKFAVFNCKKSHKINAYKVTLGGVDGTKVEALAICHKDTLGWNPSRLAFQVLKVKPGTAAICHFVPKGDIVWIPN